MLDNPRPRFDYVSDITFGMQNLRPAGTGAVLQIQHDGQISSVCRNRVKSCDKNIFFFSELINRATTPSARAATRGRNAIVTERWRGLRWTLRRQVIYSPDENAAADGEVVWSWRRDPGVYPRRPVLAGQR